MYYSGGWNPPVLCYYTHHIYTLGCLQSASVQYADLLPLCHVLCAGNMFPRSPRTVGNVVAYDLMVEGGFDCNTIAYSTSSTYTQRVAWHNISIYKYVYNVYNIQLQAQRREDVYNGHSSIEFICVCAEFMIKSIIE